MRISDWSSDVCSSDLLRQRVQGRVQGGWRSRISAWRAEDRSEPRGRQRRDRGAAHGHLRLDRPEDGGALHPPRRKQENRPRGQGQDESPRDIPSRNCPSVAGAEAKTPNKSHTYSPAGVAKEDQQKTL